MNIYVGNLSYKMNDNDLEAVFAKFGAVKSAKIIMDKETGRSKGFAFVEMEEASAGNAAIEALNGKETDGRTLRVNEAKPKEDTNSILKEYLELLEKNKNSFSSPSELENITKPFIEAKGLKFPQLFQPIRIALTGGTQAPSVYDILFILDFAESNARISKALEKNFQNSWF